ncbi:MAG: hypothetical protein AB7P04_07420 [Bacteriovoracia bacterium]
MEPFDSRFFRGSAVLTLLITSACSVGGGGGGTSASSADFGGSGAGNPITFSENFAVRLCESTAGIPIDGLDARDCANSAMDHVDITPALGLPTVIDTLRLAKRLELEGRLRPGPDAGACLAQMSGESFCNIDIAVESSGGGAYSSNSFELPVETPVVSCYIPPVCRQVFKRVRGMDSIDALTPPALSP